ncbi:unnamed protein product [Heligmosomoides polygyrus]|uniref:Inner membrane protein n=1 Tax=Heligmosomoides polygyrus TaxID=6339 RepID=A0A183FNG7_HELPZ|nr:unnamed protein product [Heligmosomoides polygyrus]
MLVHRTRDLIAESRARLQQTTNVSYNCVDRHMSNPDKKDDLALLWDGNFWDDDIHDYADLSWDVIEVLTQKIANIFNDYCEKVSFVRSLDVRLSEVTGK